MHDRETVSVVSEEKGCRATDRIASGLRNRLGLSRERVSFDLHEGILVLRGELASYYQKQLAQEAVRHLPDIRHVVNRIEVAATRAQLMIGST